MFRVTKELNFCFGHRLMHYNGKCRQLHGHNARAVVTVAAHELDDLGMVADFSALRRHIGDWIDRTLDHKMILHKDDPLVTLLRDQGDPVLAIDDHPTTENLAKLIYEQVEREGYPVVEVTLWETPTSYATYTPAGVAAVVGD
ncbi:MAG: 6-carboxytetrahydropterin synthase [Fimbriiglobus sp.]|jgi:6-pyruvoyltetrahydropterin/6-carboxytetrahydropterin synthase|nr:6-carboxytetrahydropterin synthase [Fimbriiglobus sp.]